MGLMSFCSDLTDGAVSSIGITVSWTVGTDP